MPEHDQAERDLVLFALLCLAAMRTGALRQRELLRSDEAVRGLQLLAERDEWAAPQADDARMAAVWERYGPAAIVFQPAWMAVLRSEQRLLDDALELATATVNYWERGPAR
jgi:hypothetical protein